MIGKTAKTDIAGTKNDTCKMEKINASSSIESPPLPKQMRIHTAVALCAIPRHHPATSPHHRFVCNNLLFLTLAWVSPVQLQHVLMYSFTTLLESTHAATPISV